VDRSCSPSGSTTKRIATPQNFSHLIAKSVRKPVSKALTNLGCNSFPNEAARLGKYRPLCRRHARSNNKSGRFDRLFAAMHESAIGPTENCDEVRCDGRCQGISGLDVLTVSLVEIDP